MIAIAVNIVAVIATAVFAVIYTRAYLNTDKTRAWYARIWDAALVSWTVLWNGAVVVAVGIINGSGFLADELHTGLGDQIKSAIDARYLTMFLVGVLVVSTLARLRSLFGPSQ